MSYVVDILSKPYVAFPSVPYLATHLALGDLYDAADLSAILDAAVGIARELTGRAVGVTQFRLSFPLQTRFARVALPFPSPDCAVDSVSVDGAVLSSSQYTLERQGLFWTLRWLSAPDGSQCSIACTSGQSSLPPELAALVLILAGDLYRSRESQTPGSVSPSSITAQWLSNLQRVHYAGPYAYEEVM